MKKVLIFGAGMVARPIVNHLLGKGFSVTLCDMEVQKASKLIDGHPNGTALAFNIENNQLLDKLVNEHDIVVSLLPWIFHPKVAQSCVKHKKNLVTSSYVKPEMQALDSAAKEAGIILLNELGLDPGIDHMSAMRIIDHIHRQGGKVEEFYSICGALVAPEVESNPLGYKFSWAPKGVVMAGNNDAQFLRHGKLVKLETEDLFKNPFVINFEGVGEMEVYPNRDSVSYLNIYGIPEAKTMYRGTFRYKGWCEIMDSMKRIGLISTQEMDMNKMGYAHMVAKLIGASSIDNIAKKVADFLGQPTNSLTLKAMEWLGCFDSTPMGRGKDTPFEVTSDAMIARMMIAPNERDMVAMQHTFLASYPDGKKEVIRSRMLDFGTPGGDTSIARTVALPAAAGVEMILNGQINAKGVHIPVIPEIYGPILSQLEKLGISMDEQFGLPLSDNIA